MGVADLLVAHLKRGVQETALAAMEGGSGSLRQKSRGRVSRLEGGQKNREKKPVFQGR